MENLIAWVDALKKDLDIPSSIKDAGVDESKFQAQLDALAVDAFDDQCTGANPRYPLIAEFRAVLEDSYYGRPYVELADRNQTAAAPKATAKTKVNAKVEVKVVEAAATK